MPEKEWLNKFDSVKKKFDCKIDLEAYFSEKQIGVTPIDILEIGNIHFPTGTVFACDPMIELEDAFPYIQKVPVGTYPVKICVVPSEKYGDRYACVKVEISAKKPSRYEMGMTGKERLDEELKDGDFFGFGVDAGMGCIADIQTQREYKKYWQKRCEKEPDIDSYDDLFCELLEESYKENPKYQCQYGDWANWTVPGTDCNILIFSSGWGDGLYPCYFGYDENHKICGIYILFIDIETEYAE